MPFRVFRREGEPLAKGRSGRSATRARRTWPRFRGFTEEWRIDAELRAEDALDVTLNKRDSMRIGDVHWGPLDGSSALVPAPGIKSIDPYDLIVAMTGTSGPPLLTEEDREALRVERTPYVVTLDAAPYRITGTVHLLPGTRPAQLLDRGNELFVMVTGPALFLNDTPLADAAADVVLVNRSYLRQVKQERQPRSSRPRTAGAERG